MVKSSVGNPYPPYIILPPGEQQAQFMQIVMIMRLIHSHQGEITRVFLGIEVETGQMD